MSRLSRWRDDIGRWGLVRFVYARIMRTVSPWVTLCGVYTRPIRRESEKHPPPPGLCVRLATDDDLQRAVADDSLGLRRNAVSEALARGDLCVATFDGDRMVAYMWRSFTTAPHLHGLWVHFRKPYRYGYRSFTRPEYRGRHLSDPMGHFLDDYCLDRGFTQSIGFIETDNYASIASDRRRGSTRKGWVGYLRLFGRTYPFRSRGARRRGFGFFHHPKTGA